MDVTAGIALGLDEGVAVGVVVVPPPVLPPPPPPPVTASVPLRPEIKVCVVS